MTIRVALTALAGLAALPMAAVAYGGPLPPPTEVSRTVSLTDAAARGMVDITGKGGYSGDQGKVDLRWKPTPGPVTITFRLEFTGLADPAADRAAISAAVAKAVSTLNSEVPTGPGIPPTRFAIEYELTRGGATPLAGHHHITVVKNPDYRSNVDGGSVNTSTEQEGTWAMSDLLNPRAFAHEAMHLAGLPDRYEDVYTAPGGARYVLPRGLDDTAEVKAWLKAHVPPIPLGGTLASAPHPGAGCDVMGAPFAACARIRRSDLKNLIAQAGVRLHADPGELLVNKDATRQDFGVGQAFDLFAPRGGTATANGLVVYCVDARLHIPTAGGAFDVIGPADALGDPSLARLAAVLRIVGGLPPDPDVPQDQRRGAQEAVWAVTDPGFEDLALVGDGTRALQILRSAGIDPSTVTDTPQIENPNAGAPGTAAVTPGGTVLPAPAPAPEPPAVVTRLEHLGLSQTTFRAGRPARPSLAVALTGTTRMLRIRVDRRVGTRWRTLGAFPARMVQPGDDQILGLTLGRLRVGTYRLRVAGVGPARSVPFTVR